MVCGRGSLAPGGNSFFNKKAPHIDFEIIFIDHISYLLNILCCMKYIYYSNAIPLIFILRFVRSIFQVHLTHMFTCKRATAATLEQSQILS